MVAAISSWLRVKAKGCFDRLSMNGHWGSARTAIMREAHPEPVEGQVIVGGNLRFLKLPFLNRTF